MADEYLEGIMKKVRATKPRAGNATDLQPSAVPNPLSQIARPASEYHEDMGDVLWWYVKNGQIVEAPYVGTPNTLGFEVAMEVELAVGTYRKIHAPKTIKKRIMVGGWPGYHTHFTHIVEPIIPKKARRGSRAKTSKC